MRFLCGTPEKKCLGSRIFSNAGLGKSTVAHTSSVDAFRCHKRYLINELGYEAIGSRELRSPDGSGILVLSKQSKFGMPLRKGKNQDGKGNRYQPKGRAAAGGLIRM
jgi:hypothetical protein